MQFWCSIVFINTPYCLIKKSKPPFKMFWNANPSNWYRLAFSNFHCSVFLQPISVVQPALLPWRRTRATRSVGTWAWPDCSMAVRGIGGCANTFLPLSSGTYGTFRPWPSGIMPVGGMESCPWLWSRSCYQAPGVPSQDGVATLATLMPLFVMLMAELFSNFDLSRTWKI